MRSCAYERERDREVDRGEEWVGDCHMHGPTERLPKGLGAG